MHNSRQRCHDTQKLQHVDLIVKKQVEARRNCRSGPVRTYGPLADSDIMRIARIICIIGPFFGVLHA